MLIRLIYVSRSADPVPLSLHSILDISVRNNAKRGVTGALGFLEGVFIQYLEGEAAEVDRLYRRIERDPLHVDPHILDRSEIDRRLFSRWAMGLLEWDEGLLAIFRKYNPDAALDLYAADPATVGQLFADIAASPSWTTVSPDEPPPSAGQMSRF